MELKNLFAQDREGNILAGAWVYLYEEGSTVPVADIRDKNDTPLTNPFQADGQGLIQVAAPNGRYDLRVRSGLRDYTITVQFYDITGATGTNGWSPVLAYATDDTRIVAQIVDWQGGQGTKPAAGLYIGATGLVSDITKAVNIRGPNGQAGADGVNGLDGADGLSAYEVAVINGFEGDEEEWLESLVGPQGPQGPAGSGSPEIQADVFSDGTIFTGVQLDSTASLRVNQVLAVVMADGTRAGFFRVQAKNDGLNTATLVLASSVDSDYVPGTLYAGSLLVPSAPLAALLPSGGSADQVLKKNSGTSYDVSWKNESGGGGGSSAVFDLRIGYEADQLPPAGAKPFKMPVGEDILFPANLAGSFAVASVAATNEVVININKGGSTVATLTFAASSDEATVSTQAAISFDAADVLTVEFPLTQDDTLAGVQLRLIAEVV